MPSILVKVSTIFSCFIVNTIIKKFYENSEIILLVSEKGIAPEASSELLNFINKNQHMFSRYKRIIYFNEIIYPYHPSQLSMKKENETSKEYLKKLIGYEHVDILILEGISVSPSRFIAELYSKSEIFIYGDGLMVYSPTRFSLPKHILDRVCAIYYIDLINNVKPLLLSESKIDLIPVSISLLKEQLMIGYKEYLNGKNIIIVGQYLSDLNIISYELEILWYKNILKYEFEKNGRSCNYIFRPHPSASIGYTLQIVGYAKTLGICLGVDINPEPLECRYNEYNTQKIVGIFSTSLFTMNVIYGIEAESFFTEELYKLLTPFENSNRIPIVLSWCLFDKNHQKINSDQINIILNLHAISINYDKFSFLLNLIDIFDAAKIYNFLNNGAFFSAINEQISIIKKENELRKNKMSNKIISQISVSQLRLHAEECIKNKNYEQAKILLAKALVEIPNNRNCINRYRAVSSRGLMRIILLKMTKKFEKN